MNSSQLLYKISNLQYSIRMKEVEYATAKRANAQPDMDLHNTALTLLRDDLTAAVKEFNSIPLPGSGNSSKGSKKTRWWQGFFNLKPATNRK